MTQLRTMYTLITRHIGYNTVKRPQCDLQPDQYGGRVFAEGTHWCRIPVHPDANFAHLNNLMMSIDPVANNVHFNHSNTVDTPLLIGHCAICSLISMGEEYLLSVHIDPEYWFIQMPIFYTLIIWLCKITCRRRSNVWISTWSVWGKVNWECMNWSGMKSEIFKQKLIKYHTSGIWFWTKL